MSKKNVHKKTRNGSGFSYGVREAVFSHQETQNGGEAGLEFFIQQICFLFILQEYKKSVQFIAKIKKKKRNGERFRLFFEPCFCYT